MDRRQVMTGLLAAVGSSGAGSLIASLEPALIKSQPLLQALGGAAVFGSAVGFLVLLITAPTHKSEGGIVYQRPPFLNEQMRWLVVIALCVGIPFFLLIGLVFYSAQHQLPH
jgi:hypothetical protein